MGLKEESEALDESNPDKRLPQQIKDKIVEADNEFEDSTKSGNKNESDSSAGNTASSVNDSSLKTKGTTDNVSTDTATKKSTDGSETSKAASGKDDKEEPMDVDHSAEKEEKSKSVTKTSDASGTAT